MRFAVVLFAVALSLPALADGIPEKGEGTLSILGGARFVPSSSAYVNEQGATHRSVQPGVLAAFGYMPDDELHFKIELGYGVDSYKFMGGDQLSVRTISILLGLDTALVKGSWYGVYAGGGLGYLLNSGTRQGKTAEANATGAYLALGVRVKLNEHFAAVLEDRYTLASAAVDQTSSNTLVVGGNLLSLGILFHFNSPDDKGHPRGPND